VDQTQNPAQTQVARSAIRKVASAVLMLARRNEIAPIERIVDEDAHVVAVEAAQEGTPGR
jgi:hypothetical protein